MDSPSPFTNPTKVHDSLDTTTAQCKPDTTSSPDSAGVWVSILESMTEYDRERLEDWKDDLANLLVFAGLLSSVLAGFVIESYGWLRVTNDDASVQLLAQISMQLASFSVVPGFINATSPAAPLQTLSPPSGPSFVERRINILWFLSLALSLIASLLAIMVQQWLREYRLPGYLSTRDAARLRQLRYQSLEDWGVPHIVYILPILLQVALILFLTGLSMLLSTLDELVAKVFISFVGVALTAYSCFTILPIAFKRCPYKNYVAFSITVVGNILAAIGVIVVVLAVAAAVAVAWVIWEVYSRLSHKDVSTWGSTAIAVASRTINYGASRFIIRSRKLSGRQFWTSRELHILPKMGHLDRDALAWVPTAMPKSAVSQLEFCLPEMSPEDQVYCVAMWTAENLNISPEFMHDAISPGFSPFTPQILRKVDESFAQRYRAPLLAVLPCKLEEPKGGEKFYGPAILGLLRQIGRATPVDHAFIQGFSQKVLQICSALSEDHDQLKEDLWGWKLLSVECLFECASVLRCKFSDTEVSSIIKISEDVSAALYPVRDPTEWIEVLETVMTSHATTLCVFAQTPNLLRDQQLSDRLLKLLSLLDNIVVSEKERLLLLGRYPENYLADGTLLVFVPAISSLCQSLVLLAEAGMLHLEEGSVALSLMHHLLDALQTEAVFQNEVDSLRRFFETRRGDVTLLSSVHGTMEKVDEGNSDKEHEAVLTHPLPEISYISSSPSST